MAELDLGMVRPPIIDNLTSARTDASLSANQGKALKALIDATSTSELTAVSPASSSGNGSCKILVNKATGIAVVYGIYVTSDTIAPNAAMFAIPEAYRPKTNAGIAAVVTDSSANANITNVGIRSSDGVVYHIGPTSTNSVAFFGAYQI